MCIDDPLPIGSRMHICIMDVSKEELSNFLAKVDEIGDLVKGLVNSDDPTTSSEAIDKADRYIHQKLSRDDKEGKIVQDRSLFNTTEIPKVASEEKGVTEEQTAFFQSVEEDAKERAERRREREMRGKEAKKKGNKAFREGNFDEALQHFSDAIRETPWDLTLYTNRALTYNKLCQHSKAIEDCDNAIRFEPATLKAYIHKGIALKGLEKFDEAEECFKEALKLFPEHKQEISIYLQQGNN